MKASHSCKMERVSDEKLFYLRSRGIGRQSALDMMIESYVTELFTHLQQMDQNLFVKILDNV